MASVTEGIYTAEWLISEADGGYSRENIIVVSGSGVLPSGRLLGKISVGGKYANYNDSLSNGTEVAAGILLAPVDATSSDVKAVIICRMAQVIGSMITAATVGHLPNGKTDLGATISLPGSGLIIFR